MCSHRLTLDDRWCFACKEKATVSCMMGHSTRVVIMESKPTSFFLGMDQTMKEEEEPSNSTIEDEQLIEAFARLQITEHEEVE